MPRTKLDRVLPNPSAVSKLVEMYLKIECRCSIDQAVALANCSKGLYYRRIKSPANFTLAELRSFGKALKIPQEELVEAIAAAIRY